MTDNRYLTYLLFEDNGPISAGSVAQILSSDLAWTFLLFNVLITGLFHSLVSCSFTRIPYPVLLSKNLLTILANAL